MKTNDFISDIGDMLGEDFTKAPIWTRANILSYLRKTLKRFAQATLVVDSDSIRYVDGTTGEATVPANFLNAYYNTYDKIQLDIVPLGELDFITATWSLGTTGVSPLASTVMGTGGDATIRVTPVPTNTTKTSVDKIIADTGGALWTLGVSTAGALTMTSGATGTSETLVLKGTTGTSYNYWDLVASTSGVLSTTLSAETVADSVDLSDSSGMTWTLTADYFGVLVTTNTQYGKVIRLSIDGVNQDFTSNYGIISDAYAQGVTTTPAHVVRLDSPFGTTSMGKTSEGALHTWYKALLNDTPNTESQIHLNDCYIPIIQHGVLALAFSAEGSGRDLDKSKALEMIFTVECDSVRRIFNKK